MSELYLHLEPGLDHEAARRCGYSAATPGVPPMHLLQIRAAAALRIEYRREQEQASDPDLGFHLSSWAVTPPYDCGKPVDEADILEQLRVQCALSDRIVTWTPAKTPRLEVVDVIHSPHWTESFDAPTQPVFAVGAPGAAEQGWRPAGGVG
jgi:hypothetical protein